MCDNVCVVPNFYAKDKPNKAGCTESADMHITDASSGGPEPGAEPCRFPKLEECAHFHYERVQLPRLTVTIQTNNMDQSLHSQHSHDDGEWHMLQVSSGRECWLLQRNVENFRMLDSQLHQCIYDRKISQLPDLSSPAALAEAAAGDDAAVERALAAYLERLCAIADNSINCGPVLNWLQMDNKGHRLLVPSEESRSINTPAVAAAYSVRRYVSQARDELNLEVGDMISVIDMASPGESSWWRGKRGFQVGFFPQHCVHIIGDKVPRNMPLPAPVVGSLAITPIKPVLRKHGKLIAFFRSFILNRPSRRRLKQSGILRERVFSCDLGEHLLNSGHEIPMVLKCCAEFIETRGIVDGIYRLSGVTTNIQKLRNAFDEDRIPDLYTEDILKDIHSVPSLLKMYFRELPNPLCTYQLYQSFVAAVQGCHTSLRNSETDHERLLKMREAVQKLPPPHYRTLEYLMRHLARVAKHGNVTSMTTRNVAIVWAPNLLRCADLEIGGAAALQGVGIQAVVTEFLICYADLIFCDNLPNLDRPMMEAAAASSLSPKRSRPKSLAISTPTKLITLEEARSKHHLLNKDCGYIEVGGGPDNLPKKYHTIIELPHGARKRGLAKRSPSGGWRSFFTKSRNASQGTLSKARKASTPGIVIAEKVVTESDLKRKLRSVKSAESLTSGHSEPATNDIDILGPLHCLNKPPGHNRSVSHDSYFDTLQSSHNNSEGSLLDLSEIQLNFELEESEMRIFSEDESLVSSPRMQKDANQRRLLGRPRHDDLLLSAGNSANPSPKKQPRVVMSPESMSRKRTRLEDQLSDIQFIDCNTPDNVNPCTLATTAVVHIEEPDECMTDSYQPRNKSPRNSEIPDLRLEKSKRQSLNLDGNSAVSIPKSLTEVDIGQKLDVQSATSTPLSPLYKPLVNSSSNTTPGDYSPSVEVIYQKLNKSPGDLKVKTFDLLSSPTKKSAPKSPTYENVLTTISITYKSPTKSVKTPSDSVYEDVEIRTESAQVPTSAANLPVQQAKNNDARPKSFNDIETLRKSPPRTKTETEIDALFANLKSTIDNNSLTDLSLSEVLNSSSECLHSNRTSASLPLTPTRGTLSPNVSPTEAPDTLSQDMLTPTSLSTSMNASKDSLKSASTPLDKTDESPLVLNDEDSEIDSFPKCDTTLSELYDTYDQLARQNSGNWEDVHYENVAENEEITIDGQKCDIYDGAVYENVEFGTGKVQQNKTQSRENSMEDVVAEKNEIMPQNTINDDEFAASKIDVKEKTEFGKVSHFGITSNIVANSPFQMNQNAAESAKFQINQNATEPAKFQNDQNATEPAKFQMNQNVTESGMFQSNPRVSEDSSLRKNFGSKSSLSDKKEFGCNNVESINSEKVEYRHKPNVLEIVSDRPKSINLIEFSPLVENVNEKRKQTETEATDSAIYQQVKFFRRSVHEVNTLLDLEKSTEQVVPAAGMDMNVEMASAETFDSLESDSAHIYENCEVNNVYENVEFSSDSLEATKNDEKVNVKNLTSRFEAKEEKPKLPFDVDEQAQIRRSRKFKDGLPPCLRARNLKNAIKTRSLDEEEFRREFDTLAHSRRKSLDENVSYNINTLPKSLNKPKTLPGEDPQMQVVHLAHSIESVNENAGITASNQNLNRENIEKYKEARRKHLHDKYRPESFKEDKDVLLSRFKVFKPKEDEELPKNKEDEERISQSEERIVQSRLKDEERIKGDVLQSRLKDEKDVLQSRLRNEKDARQPRFKDDKTTRKGETNIQTKLKDKPSRDTVPQPRFKDESNVVQPKFKDDRDILQSRFKDDKDIIQARFKDDKDFLHLKFKEESKNRPFKARDDEANPLRKSSESLRAEDDALSRSPKRSSIRSKTAIFEGAGAKKEAGDGVELRSRCRREAVANERQRHTFENREREPESVDSASRRVSLDPKPLRREKTSPSYCIKDMKAIFESKSHQ